MTTAHFSNLCALAFSTSITRHQQCLNTSDMRMGESPFIRAQGPSCGSGGRSPGHTFESPPSLTETSILFYDQWN
eukprot:CAMPEP_0170749194 /NCGR_PEP_ID=MMETSP0437-20130122/10267_1 /TAXON_ID=0 /ORGANISM="Sexangularia sp." /LENGTH=74 /DNA_ID=CAMNT_0011088105 /DNA_START=1342 /DNA_END=1564 /DNA_ORIENTATION=+